MWGRRVWFVSAVIFLSLTMPGCSRKGGSASPTAADSSEPVPSVEHKTNDGELYAAVNDERRKWLLAAGANELSQCIDLRPDQ